MGDSLLLVITAALSVFTLTVCLYLAYVTTRILLSFCSCSLSACLS